MKTRQPKWEIIANLGDVSLEYGGYFIYKDKTGVYPEVAEMFYVPAWHEDDWVIYRFTLEKCTFQNGILSDNKFHPEHPAWFADEMDVMASSHGLTNGQLIEWFCSDDPLQRAEAYRVVGEYHGFENLDSYPFVKSRKGVEKRYQKDLVVLKKEGAKPDYNERRRK